jgi:DNA-binding response OmpR family regulator
VHYGEHTAATPTVLVVDEHEAVTTTFERVLILGGFRILRARNALEALQSLDAHRPDAVILGVSGPIVNDLGLLYRLRGLDTHQHLPVLVVTDGSLRNEMLAELAALGATVRDKPLAAHELLVEMRRLLNAR